MELLLEQQRYIYKINFFVDKIKFGVNPWIRMNTKQYYLNED